MSVVTASNVNLVQEEETMDTPLTSLGTLLVPENEEEIAESKLIVKVEYHRLILKFYQAGDNNLPYSLLQAGRTHLSGNQEVTCFLFSI